MEKLKLLIAEDDALVRDLYEQSLSGHAFDIEMVENGEDALKSYKKSHPELILLDSVMPVMTGYSVLKEIRKVCNDKATQVVMVTSLSKGDDVMSFVRLGICGYIVKPFEPDELAAKVMAYCSKVMPDRAKEALALHDSTIEQWREELEQKKRARKDKTGEASDNGGEANLGDE